MVTREQISDVSSKKKKVGTISKKKGKSSKYGKYVINIY